jgi:hypothetical protein
MNKPGKVVMLPSERSTYGPELILETNCFGENFLKYQNVPWIPNSEKRQHLYILSSYETPKNGDWCYNGKDCVIFLYGKSELKVGMKVIVSTDPNLKLPAPSISFIKEFITSYNEGVIIMEVLVDYTYDIHKYGITHHARENFRPKLNKDNEVSIKVAEEEKVYTSKQIRSLFHKFNKENLDPKITEKEINEWLNNNII